VLERDTSFNPVFFVGGQGNSPRVDEIAVQPDGKILVAGWFSSVNGQPRNNLARLNPDGSLDDFNGTQAGANGAIPRMAVLADGKILMAGGFDQFNGQPRVNLARLFADGTLESTATFNPGVSPVGSVQCMALQPDGKIVLGGSFTTWNGQPRHGVVRLFPDGQLDETAIFSTPVTWIYNLALDLNGRILVSAPLSSFSINGEIRHRVIRFLADGTFDPSFGNWCTSADVVNTLAVRPGGAVLLGGGFVESPPPPGFHGFASWGVASLATNPRRLWFPQSPGVMGIVTGSVFAIALQADGKAVIGGYLGVAQLGTSGQTENHTFIGNNSIRTVALDAEGRILAGLSGAAPLVRLHNTPASRVLAIDGSGTLRWTHSGSAPEFTHMTFEQSDDGGRNWTTLGTGAPTTGGWFLPGQTVPAETTIRAMGRTRSGGSYGLIEQTVNIPDIAVWSPAGVILEDGASSVTLSPVVPGHSGASTFTISNPGPVTLKNLAVAVASGGNASDFSVTQPLQTTLVPGATTTFTVIFTPAGAGVRAATVEVTSNDADSPFEIGVTARLTTAHETWRVLYFGSPDNSGPGADLSDPDADGLANLMEFATHTHPQEWSPPPGTLVKNGTVLEFTYPRAKAALAEVDFVREFSATLSGLWSQTGSTVETILSDDGVVQMVRVNTPAGITGQRFVRLRVTRR